MTIAVDLGRKETKQRLKNDSYHHIIKILVYTVHKKEGIFDIL